MTLDARFEVNHPEVVDESVDGEVLIVHLGTGAYYSSRGTGDSVWQLLAAGASPREVASALADGGPEEEMMASIVDFATELFGEGLIRPRRSDRGESPVLPRSSFQAPVLEKYTDMQELLLLDPIHDVEEEGWPKAKPAGPEA